MARGVHSVADGLAEEIDVLDTDPIVSWYFKFVPEIVIKGGAGAIASFSWLRERR